MAIKLPRAKPVTVYVGIKAGAKYPDGTPVALVARVQEYGLPEKNIPPRPFLHEALRDIQDWDLPGLFAAGGADLVGHLAADTVKKKIITWTTPPNADSTIARKGTNSPLRETMHMYDSVTWWRPKDE